MNKNLNAMIERVALHYRENLQYQLARLEKDSPIEYAITLRKLDKWVSPGGRIADIGTGAGHYALHLANKGCSLYLVDIAESLLDVCRNKFREANLEQYILGTHLASAVQLDFIPSCSVDVVIMIGPLYHLCTTKERRAAIQVAWRILKPGGIIFAGGINRLAVFRELWNADRFGAIKKKSPQINSIKPQLFEFINTGETSESIFPALSNAFCATSHQFREEFIGYFNELEFLGVESFTAHAQTKFLEKKGHLQPDWLDLVEITGKTNEGIASSEHFLFIGEKMGGLSE